MSPAGGAKGARVASGGCDSRHRSGRLTRAPDARKVDGVSRGRVLAIRFGLNPNSSSLGVDVTFLLAGAAFVAAMTPVVAALLRWRRPGADPKAP